MKKKNKLESTYSIDFELAGIVCNKKEYKLAWHINSALKVELIKQPDIRITFSNQSSIVISNFKYETEFIELYLIPNRLVVGGNKQLLIPELKQFDYLLRLKDSSGELTIENLCLILREISLVEYIARLDPDELKSKENLLY